MRELLWRIVAAIVSRPAVADWLIRRSQRTPYYPITSREGTDVYMGRWWLFNAYGKGEGDKTLPPRWPWLPSIRVHHILRADDDDHMHDHPWNARTIVLRGWYEEERPLPAQEEARILTMVRESGLGPDVTAREVYKRPRGYTGRVLFGQYHRISEVPPEGVYTLWFTWAYRGTWGFLVNGEKVPYKTYLADKPRT